MYVRRAIKIVVWILAGILVLIILAVAALQFHGVQHYIVQKALSSISKKTQTRMEIGSISIAFTHSIVLHDVYIESSRQDTLLSFQTLAVDINLLKLLSHTIELKHVRIDSLTAHVTRTRADSSFNFDFILKAISPEPAAGDVETSAGPGWKIDLGGVSLNGIRGTYTDEVSGLDLHLRLGALEASVDTFDIDKLRFYAGEVALTNTTASIIQNKETASDTVHSAAVHAGLRALSMAKIHFKYENIATGDRYSADLGSAILVAEKIDLPSHRIAVKKFLLEHTNVEIAQSGRAERTAKKSTAVQPWSIGLEHLILNANSARYDVRGAAAAKGLDVNHLQLDGLTMQADNLIVGGNRLAADFIHTAVRGHSGSQSIELRELSGGFALDSLHARLSNFTVETAASRIHLNTLLGYSSLSALESFSGTVSVNSTIGDSHLAISDVLFFLPSLPIKNKPGATIQLSTRLSGLVRDLRVEEFRAAAGDSTSVDLSGSIRGLPEVQTALYDMNLRLFTTTRNDIRAMVVDSLLPKNIIPPSSLQISGNFKGTVKNFTASTDIATSIGHLKGNLAFNSDPGPGSKNSRWKTNIAVEEFNVGSLLNDSATFGPVSLTASAAGTGLSKDDIQARLNVQVGKAVVNGYPYRRISLEGTASPKMFVGKAEIQDSNIALVFNGTVNMGDVNPAYKFTLDLKGANLHRLNITQDDIRISGILTSDLTGKNINDINGTADMHDIAIIKNGRRYDIDSVAFASACKKGQSHIRIDSPILSGRFDGTIAPGDLPDVLKEYFGYYFSLPGGQKKNTLQAQAFTFHIDIREPATLTDVFLPELRRLSAGTIAGNFDSGRRNLNVTIDIPGFEYSGFMIDSLAVRVSSDADYLRATLNTKSIADSMLRITNLQLSGIAGHDSIDVAMKISRDDGFTKISLAGLLNSVPDGYEFRFKKDGIVLQNLPWSVSADNYLLFGKNQLSAHSVVLQCAGQSISLASPEEKSLPLPLRIEFKDFNLAAVSQVVERDPGLLGGILNGNIILLNKGKQRAFTSDLAVKDFTFSQQHIGDISLRANNQAEDTYEMQLDISGNGNQIALQGKYQSVAGGNVLDLTCDFTKVNLASIEPFTFGSIHRLSGTMTGGLKMTGTLKAPVVTGNLKFTDAAFSPALVNTYLHLNDGRIKIDNSGIEFSSFDLVDTLGNKASLSGNLMTRDFRSFRYDFRVHSEKFLLLNRSASRDALYYGTIILTSDISVKGDQKKQIVTMQAELDKGTNLAIVLPESELAVEERKGIVRFVDLSLPSNSIMSRKNLRTDRDTADVKSSSMELTSNITVNKDSKLRILIDPISGDSLVIRGEATMSFTMSPGGKITLTGRYDILDGSYRLSFGDFIRREFAIAQGSSLTWLGSPYDADVDITAIYTTKTQVLDLIQDQLTGISQEERNKYKQELPIQVYLMMKGKLLKPEIHFKLDLPPDKRGVLNGTVYAKLNELNGQESELNKQVFALLVLGRFISASPLASVAGTGGLTDFARSSASQILSAQLNRLSEQYIRGVSLNVGLASYQDYSTGNAEGRTQVQLALSKQLFAERVTVQVGGNVDVEGRRSQENSLNNFAGDLKVLYKLTEDGRWQAQVFRQNSYEGAIDGDITKTGVGVMFTIDFDKLFGVTLKPVTDKSGK